MFLNHSDPTLEARNIAATLRTLPNIINIASMLWHNAEMFRI